ncbi:ParB/Srx family N-terminal domain-containing protein [Sphingomonas sp. MMS24-JH45]
MTYRRPDDLVAYARHARKHPENQLVKLAASICEFGFTIPVLVATGGEIIAGHARVEAATRVGLTEIPTIAADHLSPAQVKAYRLADNRLHELGSWDLDALVVELQEIVSFDEIETESMGWSTAEMDALFVNVEADDGSAPDPADAQIEPPTAPRLAKATFGCLVVIAFCAARRWKPRPGTSCWMVAKPGWSSPTPPITCPCPGSSVAWGRSSIRSLRKPRAR